MTVLEDRLRAALDAEAEAVATSPDAWLTNAQRLTGRRRTRRLRFTAAVGALAVGCTAAWFGLLDHGTNSRSAVPASVPAAHGAIAETYQDENGRTTVRLALQDDGRTFLCFAHSDGDANKARANACRDGRAERDDPSVAFDYLVTAFDENWETLAGAVDERVATVRARRADGSVTDVPTVALGRGLRGFSITAPDLRRDPQDVPVTVMAYDASENLLEAENLAYTFGGSAWSDAPSAKPTACEGAKDPSLGVPHARLQVGEAATVTYWLTPTSSAYRIGSEALKCSAGRAAVNTPEVYVDVEPSVPPAEISVTATTEDGKPLTTAPALASLGPSASLLVVAFSEDDSEHTVSIDVRDRRTGSLLSGATIRGEHAPAG